MCHLRFQALQILEPGGQGKVDCQQYNWFVCQFDHSKGHSRRRFPRSPGYIVRFTTFLQGETVPGVPHATHTHLPVL
jgi:hypothetical protein